MPTPRGVYLGGPEVFLPDALAILAKKAAMCTEFGFVAKIPGDNHMKPPPTTNRKTLSREIYAANVATMKICDFGLFDLTPFRGPSADVGTVFELGLMTGMGKPVFGYSNVPSDYIDRIGLKQQALSPEPPGSWRDEMGWSIENFGNADNLMIDGALAARGGEIIRGQANFPGRIGDLTAFRACLTQARDWFIHSAKAK